MARRAQGEIQGGKTPTRTRVVEGCQEFCSRPHLSRLLVCRAIGDESTAMAMLWRRVRGSGVVKSLRELCDQLDRVKEVVNVYANGPTQRVLTQTTKLQDRLLETLGLAYPLNLTASAARDVPEKK